MYDLTTRSNLRTRAKTLNGGPTAYANIPSQYRFIAFTANAIDNKGWKIMVYAGNKQVYARRFSFHSLFIEHIVVD
jgi:hypothetical protein